MATRHIITNVAHYSVNVEWLSQFYFVTRLSDKTKLKFEEEEI